VSDIDVEDEPADAREKMPEVWLAVERHGDDIERLARAVKALREQRKGDRKWADQRFGRIAKRLDGIMVKLKTICQHLGIKSRKSRAVARESARTEAKVKPKVTPPGGAG
jgi:hypothetical protein